VIIDKLAAHPLAIACVSFVLTALLILPVDVTIS
jgi:hypothetical protein